jgi:flagellar hook-associated protein 1 FlgK
MSSLNLDTALRTAASGIAATQAQIAVLSDNIANAGSAGYTQKTLGTTAFVAGTLSIGVRTGNVARSVDLAMQQSLLTADGQVGGLTVQTQVLQAINNVQGVPGAGTNLSDGLTAVQNGFTTLLADPSSAAYQSAAVSAASTLATSINTMANVVQTQRNAVQAQIVTTVANVNTALQTADRLTHQIMVANAAGQSTAALQDQRDAAMLTISGALDVRYIAQPNGSITILGQNGFTLPLNATLATASATTTANQSYASGSIPPITIASGNPNLAPVDVTTKLTGGTLGELIALRDSTLPGYTAQLDEFSQKLASRFQQQGLTLFSNGGGTVPAATVPPALPADVGFSSVVQVNPAVLAAPHLVRDGTASFAANAAQAAFTVNNTAAGGTAGFATLIQNVLTYSLGANVGPTTANTAFATSGMGPDGTLSTAFTSPPTLAGYASLIVAGQSTDTANAKTGLTNAQAYQTTLSGLLSAGSGVNVDQQMGLMIQLQNSYQANARIMQASQTMFTALINAINSIN